MASDGRSRDRDRPRRRRPEQPPLASRPPVDADAYDDDEPRPVRRRTSVVPRQGSSSPRRGTSEWTSADRYRRPQEEPRQRVEPASEYDYEEDPDDQVIAHPGAPAPAAPRWRRAPRQEPTRRSTVPDPDEYDDYGDQFDDSFIDEDDWYEEEAAGAQRRSQPRPRRRSDRSAQRPAISIPRPNISRPTVPVRIREAALVNDQNAVILAAVLVLSVLLMALFTSNRVEDLAPGFATHVSASGLPEDVRSEDALWRLPLMAGALLLMNLVLAWVTAPRSTFLSRFFLGTSVIVQVLVWVAFLRIVG